MQQRYREGRPYLMRAASGDEDGLIGVLLEVPGLHALLLLQHLAVLCCEEERLQAQGTASMLAQLQRPELCLIPGCRSECLSSVAVTTHQDLSSIANIRGSPPYSTSSRLVFCGAIPLRNSIVLECYLRLQQGAHNRPQLPSNIYKKVVQECEEESNSL